MPNQTRRNIFKLTACIAAAAIFTPKAYALVKPEQTDSERLTALISAGKPIRRQTFNLSEHFVINQYADIKYCTFNMHNNACIELSAITGVFAFNNVIGRQDSTDLNLTTQGPRIIRSSDCQYSSISHYFPNSRV